MEKKYKAKVLSSPKSSTTLLRRLPLNSLGTGEGLGLSGVKHHSGRRKRKYVDDLARNHIIAITVVQSGL